MFDVVRNNGLTIGLLAVVIAVGAWYFLGGSPESEAGLVTESFVTPQSEAERDLVATLLQLRAVTLNDSIFQDPAFQSLADFGSEIVPEPVGRPNPFAPLEAGSSSVPTPTPTPVRGGR